MTVRLVEFGWETELRRGLAVAAVDLAQRSEWIAVAGAVARWRRDEFAAAPGP